MRGGVKSAELQEVEPVQVGTESNGESGDIQLHESDVGDKEDNRRSLYICLANDPTPSRAATPVGRAT